MAPRQLPAPQVLGLTLALLLNHREGNPPRQLARMSDAYNLHFGLLP